MPEPYKFTNEAVNAVARRAGWDDHAALLLTTHFIDERYPHLRRELYRFLLREMGAGAEADADENAEYQERVQREQMLRRQLPGDLT